MCMRGCEAANRQQCSYALHCLDGEKLAPGANPKGSGSLPAPRSGDATAITCFAHLLILEDSDHHQNLISYSLYSYYDIVWLIESS